MWLTFRKLLVSETDRISSWLDFPSSSFLCDINPLFFVCRQDRCLAHRIPFREKWRSDHCPHPGRLACGRYRYSHSIFYDQRCLWLYIRRAVGDPRVLGGHDVWLPGRVFYREYIKKSQLFQSQWPGSESGTVFFAIRELGPGDLPRHTSARRVFCGLCWILWHALQPFFMDDGPIESGDLRSICVYRGILFRKA